MIKSITSVILLTLLLFPVYGVETHDNSLIDIDLKKLVSRADLFYKTPVSRSEEGQPVGNGRMGSMVWTEPSMLKFQINRVDLFAMDGRTVSFPRADSDFGSSCGFVDICLVSAGYDVFSGKDFSQHLSIYDGIMSATGKDLTAHVIAWPDGDVIAIEIRDQRPQPEPVNINLRMLRYQIQGITGKNYILASQHTVEFRTAQHQASSILGIHDGRITLTQQYREEFKDFEPFYSASAVAITVLGRPSKARYLNDAMVQLSVAQGRGNFTILISSAATLDKKTDITNKALQELNHAASIGYDNLQKETQTWWHDYWSKGFVYMGSSSGQAEFVEQNYTFFIYLMGAASRGSFPPHFNGMLWRTTGDMARWGSQYWSANTLAYYRNLLPANRTELMEPLFSMYFNMKEACALAARQQWDSKGLWIPEISWFNGPEPIPERLIQEFQDLYLVRKPYEQRSAAFQWYVETKTRHASRYNFQADGSWDHGHLVVPTKASVQPERFGSPQINGIFGHCTHILSVATHIADLFYKQYMYTQDSSWLREKAYPMIKGAAEFYRNFPNFKKGDDGKYHIYHVNSGESAWNSADTPNEMRALKLIFPLAVRVSQALETDDELRTLWQEINENLYKPQSASNRRKRPYGSFVYGGDGIIEPIGDQAEQKARFLGFNALNGFIDEEGIGGAQIFRNRMRLREGPGAIDAEHIAGLTMGIHQTMLDSEPEQPMEQPVIRLFNDWPDSWDAAFKLRAQGAFIISTAKINGQVPFVEILSLKGRSCYLQNPWGEEAVEIHFADNSVVNAMGPFLKFFTSENEKILIVPAGQKPEKVKIF